MIRIMSAVIAALMFVFAAEADESPNFDVTAVGASTIAHAAPQATRRHGRKVRVRFERREPSVAWGAGVPLDLVAAARRHIGKGPRELGLPGYLWCGDFTNRVRREAGVSAVASRRAIDHTRHAKRLAKPVPGAIAIFGRRGGHHVGVIADVGPGWVRLISGNDGGRVRERIRSTRGLVAVVNPFTS